MFQLRLSEIFLLAGTCLLAQSTGQIAGTVKDPSGAPIPGARVVAVGRQQGLKFENSTGAEGNYAFPQLPAGSWELTASSTGFADRKIAVPLGVGQTRTVDPVLELAIQSMVVEVVTDATSIDQSSARLGTNVSARELAEMPVNGRTYSLLALAAPGATNATDGGFDKIRFHGKSAEQNKFAYDGVDASAVFDTAPGWLTVSGSQFRLQNSVETIQEFRVDSALYPAEYGTGTGGQINLISKSGGNEFHGSLFEYLRNDRLDARNFFDAAEKSRLRMNQFGANAGGPLRRNRLFLFGSVEALRQRAGLNVLESVPSATARARAVAEIRPLLDAFPAGFQSTSSPDIDLARRAAISKLDETNFSGRTDYHLSSAHRLYVRYLKDIGYLDAPDNTVTPRRVRAANKPDNLAANWNSTISPRLFNDLKFGLNRAPTALAVDAGLPSLDGIGINISGSIVQPGINGGAPSGVAMPGGVTRQSSAGNGRGSDYRGRTYSLIDNLSWVRGAHNLKAGVEFRALRVPFNYLGGLTYSFSNLDNFLANSAATVAYIGDLGLRTGRQEYYIGYVQDEWRLRPDLTLNTGLRYEYYTPNREQYNRARLLDAATLRLLDPGTSFYQADKKAFGPRLGLAWAPRRFGGKTVLRIGGGLYYGPGQFEDLIQPIESDVNRFILPGQRYPVDPALLASATLPPQTPRAYDVGGYRVPERNIQYGVSIQQQLPGQFVGQIGYTGSLGRNLFQRSITNLITAVDPRTGRVTRQNPNFGEIDYKTSGGSNSYNALQAGLSRRFLQGLTFGIQYGWAHTIGTSEGSNGSITVQDPFCFACDRGDGASDIRHYANASAVYELPFGRGRRFLRAGAASWLLGNWSVSGVFNGRTGLPINVFLTRPDVVSVDGSGRVVATAGTTAVINTPGGGASRATRRPDVVLGVSPYAKDRSGLQWLNPAAFTIPRPGAYGNLGRNALRGPGFTQLDLMLAKRLPIGERQALEFRSDIFNLLNRVNFSNPPATLPNALPALQPGQPFSFASAPGFGVTTSTVGRTVGLGTSRQIQFSLRYSF
ncbi:MAG: carboxypeptidase regulatory-like domain-containing protein [Acidobacteriota bacterium]